MSEEDDPRTPPGTRYSDDRSWWWDGEQWQPIEGSSESLDRPPPDAPRPVPRGERRAGPLVAIGSVLLVLGAVAVGAALLPTPPSPIPRGAHTAAPTATPGATPRPTAHPRSPSPRSTATPDPAAQRQRYVQVVVTESQRMTPQIDAVDQTCAGQSDLAGCRTSLVGLQAATRDFRQALSSTPAPACLQPVDVQLRQGLDLFDEGTSTSIAGIDAQDPQRLVDGMRLVQQANDHLGQANDRARSSNC